MLKRTVNCFIQLASKFSRRTNRERTVTIITAQCQSCRQAHSACKCSKGLESNLVATGSGWGGERAGIAQISMVLRILQAWSNLTFAQRFHGDAD
eukprot:1149475-Pelagomonas_calceolata.AAC.9